MPTRDHCSRLCDEIVGQLKRLAERGGDETLTVASVGVVGLEVVLLVRSQVEDLPSDPELLVDLLLRETEVRDIEEADLMNRTLELLGEGFLASGLVEGREVEVDEFSPREFLLGLGELRVATERAR